MLEEQHKLEELKEKKEEEERLVREEERRRFEQVCVGGSQPSRTCNCLFASFNISWDFFVKAARQPSIMSPDSMWPLN